MACLMRWTEAVETPVALAAYAVAYPLAAKHALVIAIALSIVAGMLWHPKPATTGEKA